ncbi:hypothetical protein ACI2L1_21455 [Streptomyces sp. NPDC019531]|uniref:hypothetical protein n=1 Tax=Streptomyces sp. NPDC019531 TaxID=3365062 RepID=UPI00384BAB55
MGVFARLLRRSKATEEASTAETQAATRTAEPTADEAAEVKGSTGTEGEGTTEAGNKAETGPDVTETAAAEDAEGSTATEAVDDGAFEDVEIPKQQSTDEAAEREAGEGART